MKHDLLGSYANIWVRQKVFSKKGETIGGHKHKYDHMSLLAVGKVMVEVDGITKELEAPTFLVIPKGKIHNITALTDDVLWYCVFAHRDVNGDVYDADSTVEYDELSHAQAIKKCSINLEDFTINVNENTKDI